MFVVVNPFFLPHLKNLNPRKISRPPLTRNLNSPVLDRNNPGPQPPPLLLHAALPTYDGRTGAVLVGSPLVEQKSAVMGGVALSWIFRRSERVVER